MKKLIGLIPLYDDDKDSYWMLPGYMKVLEACGAIPVMLPLTTDHAELDDCFKICDGILMTGGHDVDPALYAETAKKTCGIPCSSRDKMEAYLFEKALQEDKPVFGICRMYCLAGLCIRIFLQNIHLRRSITWRLLTTGRYIRLQ